MAAKNKALGQERKKPTTSRHRVRRDKAYSHTRLPVQPRMKKNDIPTVDNDKGEILSMEATENTCTITIPVSLLSTLTSKIDDLTNIVQKQSEELLDVERRLKNDFKNTRKILTDQITSLSQKIDGKEASSSRTSSTRTNYPSSFEKPGTKLDSRSDREHVRSCGRSQSQEKKGHT